MRSTGEETELEYLRLSGVVGPEQHKSSHRDEGKRLVQGGRGGGRERRREGEEEGGR